MKNIHFFCCKNGFGHLKRILMVTKQLANLTDSKIFIYTTTNHIKKISTWKEFSFFFESPNLHLSNIMDCYPSYNEDFENRYLYDSLTYISDNLKINSCNDVVILDNDVSLLQIFNNAILMGSFLWGEIFSETEHQELKILSANEKSLLKKFYPQMICVDKMAMSWISEYTRKIGLPWFCSLSDQRNRNFSDRDGILITGGGTGKITDDLLEIYFYFDYHSENVFADELIYNSVTKKGKPAKLFQFDEESFLNLKAIICRPGLGIITDSVNYSIPIAAVVESENSEMIHNAHCIVKYNFGTKIGSDNENKSQILYEWLYSKNIIQNYRSLLKETGSGDIKAAEFILSNIKG